MRIQYLVHAIVMIAVSGCGGSGAETGSSAETSGAEQPTAAPEPGLGAAIYDKWWVSLELEFSPDDPATPGVADGSGGPNGDGTLNDADGAPMLNDAGHDYRLKNLFGWDLRGGEGIYGAAYQGKAYALPVNLLTVEWSRDALAARLASGGEGVPAYGQVLSAAQLSLVVEFVFDIREGRLPSPAQIFALSSDAPKNYTLVSGGEAARGAEVIAGRCSKCHGRDGTDFAIDGKYSLGSHGRQKAYEDWLKFIGGQPGSSMGGQLPDGDDGAAHAVFTLDVLAALCDRTAFPPVAGGDDVADGDARCGAYLK